MNTEEINEFRNETKSRLDELSFKMDEIYNQKIEFTRFRTEVEAQLTYLRKDISTIEIITSSNWSYIAQLKSEPSEEVNKIEYDKVTSEIVCIKEDLESIKRNLSKVELFTAENWADIARLKTARQ